jgi:hypothetical protein
MGKEAVIQLFDLSGKLIMDKTVNGQTQVLNLESFKSGEYILILTNATNRIIKHIVKV